MTGPAQPIGPYHVIVLAAAVCHGRCSHYRPDAMRRPWWLFYGVARETERMRYRGPWERLALAFQEGWTPVFGQVQRAFEDFGRVLAGIRVPVSPPR